ncbi:MAG: hypothetical protein Q9192_007397, partial [Flavoplaca navasiana]
RAVAYPETPIDIYLSELSETTAYETWIDGLPKGLEASIRHIGIDEFVYIDWIHDGPMPERPIDRRKRLEIESLMDIERNHGLEQLYEWNFDYDDYMGDWKVRWLQRKNGNHGSREETVSDMLDVMEERITKSNIPMGGFGKDGIRKLVASYPASQFYPNACEEYDGEYGEDFGAEYAGDYGEGYGEEYKAESEEHGREDLDEGHEQEYEKERVDPTMSSPGAWKSSINPNTAFEPARAPTLLQKDVSAWRQYNRELTTAYESVLMERDTLTTENQILKAHNELLIKERDALKRKNISLRRDVGELEDALDASDRPATAGSSEDLRSAQSKIAELESALAQARLDSHSKDREIARLRSQLETAEETMSTRGSTKSAAQDKLHHDSKTEPAEDGPSSPHPSGTRVSPPRAALSDSDLSNLFESASDTDMETRPLSGTQAGKTPRTPSVTAGIRSGQPSSLAGRLAQTSLSPASKRSRSPISQNRPAKKRKQARHESRSPSRPFQV